MEWTIGLISTWTLDLVIETELGVTRGNQTGPESGPKLDLLFCSHENRMV